MQAKQVEEANRRASDENKAETDSNSAKSSPQTTIRLSAEQTGQRVESICNQLSASVASHTSPPSTDAVPPTSLPGGMVIKKEKLDTYEDMNGGGQCQQQQYAAAAADRSHQFNPPLPKKLCTSSANMSSYLSSAGLHTSTTAAPSVTGVTSTTTTPGLTGNVGAALPGIHEVFSRRSTQLPSPSYSGISTAAFSVAGGAERLRIAQAELRQSLLASTTATSFSNTAFSTGGARPTVALPPITQVLRQTKDTGCLQNSTSPAEIPELEDVLRYYVSQGKLFRCEHCNILFFERGMYFLHASLHGNSNPWECSICRKVCSDKNEFTLHFVNQQHSV
jgi:hypothetical protein